LEEKYLIELYHEFNLSRMDYNTIKWRTIKFFTSLNGTIITASITLLVYKGVEIDLYTRFLLVPLPCSVFILSYLAMKNLKRESRLLWEQEASMLKIEKYLDFHVTVSQDKCLFFNDNHLVPPKNYGLLLFKDENHESSNKNYLYKILEKLGLILKKIDKYLGFQDPLCLPKDFPHKTLEEWLCLRWKNSEFKLIMEWVFRVEIIIALFLLLIIICPLLQGIFLITILPLLKSIFLFLKSIFMMR